LHRNCSPLILLLGMHSNDQSAPIDVPTPWHRSPISWFRESRIRPAPGQAFRRDAR
jgi:hypothetical protein